MVSLENTEQNLTTLGRGVHYYVLRKSCYFSCRFVKKWIKEECVWGHGVLRFQLSGPTFQAVYGIWLQLNLRKRMERKGKKDSEEDDYFNKFPPTMPSVVLENRLIKMFKVSYRSAPRNNTCVAPHSEHQWIKEECVWGHGVLRFQLSGPTFQAVYGIWLQLNLTCILWL
jgi:hypothetical protein